MPTQFAQVTADDLMQPCFRVWQDGPTNQRLFQAEVWLPYIVGVSSRAEDGPSTSCSPNKRPKHLHLGSSGKYQGRIMCAVGAGAASKAEAKKASCVEAVKELCRLGALDGNLKATIRLSAVHVQMAVLNTQ